MCELIRKQEQVKGTLFDGRFHSNKPVVAGRTASGNPSPVLYYWSHSVAVDDCEFGLHPHRGFEIMTFVLEGENAHYDTSIRRWTPLRKGDFQVIRSGSGLSHAERIKKGTRAFQIWLDPDLRAAVAHPPSYTDYRAEQLALEENDGITTTHYIGGGSPARAATEGVSIRKMAFAGPGDSRIRLDPGRQVIVYLLGGRAAADGAEMAPDDAAIAIGEDLRIDHDAGAELFVIETPCVPSYSLLA